jgi:uncharacterized membrane protein YedE/YeeE
MYEESLFKRCRNTLVSGFFVYRTQIFGLLTGILFGFLMSRAGATTYDYHAKMFLFEDFQLMIVIVTAVIIAMLGVWLLKKTHIHAVATGEGVDFVKKPYQKGLMIGAALFGVGWGMTASCPGTIPAMIGEGKIAGLFALAGILIGTMAYGILQSHLQLAKQQASRSTDAD